MFFCLHRLHSPTSLPRAFPLLRAYGLSSLARAFAPWVQAVVSFSEVDVADDKDGKGRTSMLLAVLPRAAVFVSAHAALASFTPPGQAAAGAVVASASPVPPLVPTCELLMATLLGGAGGAGGAGAVGAVLTTGLTMDQTARDRSRRVRTAAAARLSALSAALHGGAWARFPAHWTPTLGHPRGLGATEALAEAAAASSSGGGGECGGGGGGVAVYEGGDAVVHVARVTLFGRFGGALEALMEEQALLAGVAAELSAQMPTYAAPAL